MHNPNPTMDEAALRNALRNTLDNLTTDDFKRFRHRLRDQSQIPWSKLERADTNDTVDLMVQVYAMGAGGIMVSILQNMNHNQFAMALELDVGKYKDALAFSMPISVEVLKKEEEVIQKLKDRMKNKAERILGDRLNGKTLFDMSLHIVRRYEKEQNSQRTRKEETIECKDMFTSHHSWKELTLGDAGMGKTISVQKFILDWAEGKHTQHDFVFSLSFHELSKMKKEYSLLELLKSQFPEIQALNVPLSHFNVLFIFDGLDECGLLLDFDDENKVSELGKKTTLSALIVSVISEHLLSSACVWITSRPTPYSHILRGHVNQVTELRGFSDNQKLQYFERNCEQNVVQQIQKCVMNSSTLNMLCKMPLFCWILCTVTEEFLKNERNQYIGGNVTVIYLHFLCNQMKLRKTDGKTQNLLRLGKLAFCQLEKREQVFSEGDLEECGISTKSAEFLIVCREESDLGTSEYRFVHLSIQEFLAAFFAFYSLRNDRKDVLTKRGILQWFYWLLFSDKMLNLQTKAVDRALKSRDGHFDLFVRFLLGFTLESNQKLMKAIVPGLRCKAENVQNIFEYIRQKIKASKSVEEAINLFYCLSEMKTDFFVKEIENYLTSVNVPREDLSSAHWAALLLTAEETKIYFDLKKYWKTQGLDILLPVIKYTRKALLDNCRLSASSWKILAPVISSSSHLTALDLSHNDLQDSGVKLLFGGKQTCKLQTLRLAGCCLSGNSCKTLALALQENTIHLTTLDLSHNDIKDSGIGLLTGMITNLEILVLQKCNLTARSCKFLALSLTSSNLKDLDISGNNLECDPYDPDDGTNIFFKALKSSNCRLEALRLQNCNLSARSCEELSKALISSQLKRLDLGTNNLQDEGIKVLCSGISQFQECQPHAAGSRTSHCKMERLVLSQCNLTGKGFGILVQSLLNEGTCLTELDLSRNDLQSECISTLSTALSDPTCSLRTLRLSGCLIPQKTFSNLFSALQSNENLRELDLRHNLQAQRDDQPYTPKMEKLPGRLESLQIFPVLEMEPVLTVLKELSREDLDKFKSYLTEHASGDNPDLLKAQLDNADVEDTVRMMTQSYGPEMAFKRSQDILKILKQEHQIRLQQLFVLYGNMEEKTKEIEKRLEEKHASDKLTEYWNEGSTFFHKNKKYIYGLDMKGGVQSILHKLEQLDILSADEKMKVQSQTGRCEKNRALVDVLQEKKEWAHMQFYQIWQRIDPGFTQINSQKKAESQTAGKDMIRPFEL